MNDEQRIDLEEWERRHHFSAAVVRKVLADLRERPFFHTLTDESRDRVACHVGEHTRYLIQLHATARRVSSTNPLDDQSRDELVRQGREFVQGYEVIFTYPETADPHERQELWRKHREVLERHFPGASVEQLEARAQEVGKRATE